MVDTPIVAYRASISGDWQYFGSLKAALVERTEFEATAGCAHEEPQALVTHEAWLSEHNQRVAYQRELDWVKALNGALNEQNLALLHERQQLKKWAGMLADSSVDVSVHLRVIEQYADEILPLLDIIDERAGGASGATEKLQELSEAFKFIVNKIKDELSAKSGKSEPIAPAAASSKELSDKWKIVDGDMREGADGLLTYHAAAFEEGYQLGLAKGAQPAQHAPRGREQVKVDIELPDGDDREVKVWWSEFKGDTLQLAISIEGESNTMRPGLVCVPAAVAQAAAMWVYCPPQGGYRGGRAMEDTCEELAQAVEQWTGVPPSDDWLSEEKAFSRLPKGLVPPPEDLRDEEGCS